ncbi:hypothetical protein BX600DRAFT_146198 [Xylariales sp. PMI_506]|nr:hypothetical protein BX600DRAFT_146198 [Xylariales sp. PMI_506]
MAIQTLASQADTADRHLQPHTNPADQLLPTLRLPPAPSTRLPRSTRPQRRSSIAPLVMRRPRLSTALLPTLRLLLSIMPLTAARHLAPNTKAMARARLLLRPSTQLNRPMGPLPEASLNTNLHRSMEALGNSTRQLRVAITRSMLLCLRRLLGNPRMAVTMASRMRPRFHQRLTRTSLNLTVVNPKEAILVTGSKDGVGFGNTGGFCMGK